MKIHSQKDFVSGLMFIAVGVAFAWGASTYSVGTGARMGPGYFPLILGVLLAVLGSAVAITAVTVQAERPDPIGKFAWKPLFFIILANLVFGASIGGLPSLGLPPLGMVLGIYLLTFIASSAGDGFRMKQAFVLASILAVLSYLAFIVLLKLQFPVWPAFVSA